MRQRIAIIGAGLIGASLGLAIKQAKLDVEIVGHDKNSSAAALAKKNGALDKTEWNLINAVDGASLVIIATPANAIKATMQAIAKDLQPGAIITDTASTKTQVLAWAEEILPSSVQFVAGHPLTTTAGTGTGAASATLFVNRPYCLMAGSVSAEKALETMVNLVQSIGARPYFLDPLEHDAYVAAVGHVPFLAATALVRMAAGSPSWREMKRLAGVDFENASQPVTADPQMYNDICQTNKESILRWLDEYVARLVEMRQLVEDGGPDLLAAFSTAQDERARWLATRDDDPSEEPQQKPGDGPGSAIKQMFFGNLMSERPFPGEKPKK